MEPFDTSLGHDYPLTTPGRDAKTKDRILLEATLLFAEKGYEGVSMKDIAEKIGIRPASLYNHYESKENLWIAVMEHTESLYMMYFARLEEARPLAQTFEQTVETMFVEIMTVVNLFTYYGFSLVQAEQLRDERARRIYLDVFLKYSIAYIQGRFDECIANGTARPFDTHTVASIFMNTVLVNITLRVHESRGAALPYDITAMYEDLQRFILQQGAL